MKNSRIYMTPPYCTMIISVRIRMNLMTMIMFWISTTPTNRTTATTVVMIGIGSTAIMIGMTMMTGPIMIMTGRPTMIITNGELP